MDAVILAAGKGTRLFPLTSDRPKSMLPIAGKYLIDYQVYALISAGVKRITIVVGWGKDKLVKHVEKQNFGAKIRFITQEEQLGTAHAIACAEHVVDGDFLCVNGDILFSSEDAKKIAGGKEYAMGVCTVPDVSKYGEVLLKDNNVAGIVEKPERFGTGTINAGIYRMKRDVFDLIRDIKPSQRGEYEITDVLNRLAQTSALNAVKLSFWMEIGYPWDILKANEYYMRKIEGKVEGVVEKGAIVKGPVVLEEGAVIKSGAYIEGPVIIKSGSEVGPNCYIRPCTALYERTKVGNAVEVKNSIVMTGSKIPHHNYVGDSIIGEDCNLGSGTKIANLRLDNKNIVCSVKGKDVNTGRRKLGAIIGHNVKTGINACIYPGTIIGSNTVIGPGSHVFGTIGENRIIQ